MTDDEDDLLFEIKNQYWLDFSELINSTLEKVPLHLRDDLLDRLGEASSVYGCKTRKLKNG